MAAVAEADIGIFERAPLPASSLSHERLEEIAERSTWAQHVTRDWAWGGSTGAGAAVCVLDSGIDGSHPDVGGLAGSWTVVEDGEQVSVVEAEPRDECGHGTACAGIIRSLAPDCEISSVQVLGAANTGSGRALMTGLRWAIERGFDVINLSLSTTRAAFALELHELADSAYFRRAMLVCSAHNMTRESYPWRFSSVVSVGSHEEVGELSFFRNPEPPVEFYGRGLQVRVAWLGGGRIRATGNSFAAPQLAGICALIRAKHPELTPYQLKSVLHLTASNVEAEASR